MVQNVPLYIYTISLLDALPISMADFDVLVIGSGFGGSVTALRLSEKGYRVGVLEAGRRFTDDTLPKNSWHLRDFVWARSEEHTSELQSRRDLVCRLLLEKKNIE